MGNICYHDLTEYNKNKQPIFKKCYKCHDSFKIHSGGFSQRRSCRYHNIQNKRCLDCRLSENTIKKQNIYNCYHLKERHFLDFLCT